MERPGFLRDGFGTVARPGWEEIFVPDSIALTPQTVGWKLLAGLILGLAVWALVRLVRRYRANRYRRAALAELEGLRGTDANEASLGAIPEILKRTALCAFPRSKVASLTGGEWRAFLDATCPDAGFDPELGDALASLSYRGPETVPPATAARLYEASARWIRGHRAPV